MSKSKSKFKWNETADIKEPWCKYFFIAAEEQKKKGAITYIYSVYTHGHQHKVSEHMTKAIAIIYAKAYFRMMDETLVE